MIKMTKIKIQENKEYEREELRQLFEENKTTLEYQASWTDKKVKNTFALLEQHKPILVKNYPWGFTLKTTIKYWVEVTKRGSRFCTQTINPKTKEWCKPKKSTYNAVSLLVVDNTGKVRTISLDYNDTREKIDLFIKEFKNDFNELQKLELAKISGYEEIMQHVEFKVEQQYFKHRETGEILTEVGIFELKNVDKCTKEGVLIDEDKEEKEQKEQKEKIGKAMAYASKLKHLEIEGKLK